MINSSFYNIIYRYTFFLLMIILGFINEVNSVNINSAITNAKIIMMPISESPNSALIIENEIWLSFKDKHLIIVISDKGKYISEIKLEYSINEMTYDSKHKYLYCTSDSKSVLCINTINRKIENTIMTDYSTGNIKIDERYIYFLAIDAPFVYVIDRNNAKLLITIRLPSVASNITPTKENLVVFISDNIKNNDQYSRINSKAVFVDLNDWKITSIVDLNKIYVVSSVFDNINYIYLANPQLEELLRFDIKKKSIDNEFKINIGIITDMDYIKETKQLILGCDELTLEESIVFIDTEQKKEIYRKHGGKILFTHEKGNQFFDKSIWVVNVQQGHILKY